MVFEDGGLWLYWPVVALLRGISLAAMRKRMLSCKNGNSLLPQPRLLQRLAAAVGMQLFVDVANMGANGFNGDKNLCRNFLVAIAFCQPVEHFFFAE